MIMDNVLNSLEAAQVNLHNGYLKLKNMSGQYGSACFQRIDVTRQIDMLGEQLQWLYQDMEMELVPVASGNAVAVRTQEQIMSK